MGEPRKISCTHSTVAAAIAAIIVTIAVVWTGSASVSAQTTDCTQDMDAIGALRARIAPARVTAFTCADGYVTMLKIVEQDLQELPPEIGRLTQLRELDVTQNDLTVLPPEIGKLRQLRVLAASFNELTTLPPVLAALTNLEVLDVSFNDLTRVQPEITNLPQLTFLSLSGNTTLGVLPRAIENLTNLEVLEASYADLDVVPPEVGQLVKLKKLDLSINDITTLPVEFGNLTALATLNLSGNPLLLLPGEFADLRSLEHLDVAHTSLGDRLPFQPFVAVNKCDSGSPQLMVLTSSVAPSPVAPRVSVDGVTVDPGSLKLLNANPADTARVWKTTLARAGTGPKYEIAVEGETFGRTFTTSCADYQDEVTITSSCLAGDGRLDFMIVNEDTASRYRIAFPGLSARERTVKQTEAWRMPFTGRPDGSYEVVITKTRLADNKTTTMNRTVVVDCDSGSIFALGPEVQVISYCVAGDGFIRFQFVNPYGEDTAYVIEVEGVPNRSTMAKSHGASTRGVSGRPDGTYVARVALAQRRHQPIFAKSVTIDCD